MTVYLLHITRPAMHHMSLMGVFETAAAARRYVAEDWGRGIQTVWEEVEQQQPRRPSMFPERKIIQRANIRDRGILLEIEEKEVTP